MFTPCRGDATVQVGPRATHVQLVFVGLRGYVVPHVGAGKQELVGRDDRDTVLTVIKYSCSCLSAVLTEIHNGKNCGHSELKRNKLLLLGCLEISGSTLSSRWQF